MMGDASTTNSAYVHSCSPSQTTPRATGYQRSEKMTADALTRFGLAEDTSNTRRLEGGRIRGGG